VISIIGVVFVLSIVSLILVLVWEQCRHEPARPIYVVEPVEIPCEEDCPECKAIDDAYDAEIARFANTAAPIEHLDYPSAGCEWCAQDPRFYKAPDPMRTGEFLSQGSE
jgi:hypothetical protein